MIGTRILNYKITKKIGQGGMATVYEANHITFENRKVAIKILDPILSRNADITSRFINEAKIMASLEHPNIVKVIDFESSNEILAIIMEFLDGQNLRENISENILNTNQKIELFKQILPAFEYGHKRKIIHRDIKPSNIFLINNFSTAKVLDFGIAKLLESDNQQTATGMSMGTPMFMSPEQVKGKKDINQKTDIYSLGVLLYYMISGQTPYDKNDSQYDILTKIVNQPVPEIKNEEQLNYIIKKATAKNPAERYKNCSEFLEALKNNNELSGFISVNPEFLDSEKEKIKEEKIKQEQQQKVKQEDEEKKLKEKLRQEEQRKRNKEEKLKQEQQKKEQEEEEKKNNQRKIYNVNHGQAKPQKESEQTKQRNIDNVKQVKPKKKKRKTKIWFILLFLIAIIFAGYKLNEKISFIEKKTWQEQFGGSKNEEAFSILADENGVFIGGLTKSYGSSMDWYLIHTNSSGKVLWKKNIDAFNRGDAAHAIIKTNDGNYIVVGGSYKDDSYKSQNRIMKFDKKGKVIWNKFFGYFGWDEAVDITNADNNAFIMIFTDDTKENTRCGIFKINSNGGLIWEQSIGDYGDYSPRDILKINDYEYLICGNVKYSEKTTKAFFAKIDNDGEVIYSKIFGKSYEITSATALTTTEWGKIIIVGYTDINEKTNKDAWIAKLNDNGEMIDNVYVPEQNSQAALSVTKTFDNNFVLAGYASDNKGKTDGLLMKFDDNLDIIWKKTFHEVTNNKFNSVWSTEESIYAAGYKTVIENNKDIWVVRTDNNGEIKN